MRTSFGSGAKLAQQERHTRCREERLRGQHGDALPPSRLAFGEHLRMTHSRLACGEHLRMTHSKLAAFTAALRSDEAHAAFMKFLAR